MQGTPPAVVCTESVCWKRRASKPRKSPFSFLQLRLWQLSRWPTERRHLLNFARRALSSKVQRQRQRHQARIRRHTQRRQHHHHIPTRPKLLAIDAILIHLRKKRLIPLLPSKQAHDHHRGPIHRKQRTDAVELGREDLQHDQREAELGQRGADVGAFKGALGGADFDHFIVGEHDGAGAVKAQAVSFAGATLEDEDGMRVSMLNPVYFARLLARGMDDWTILSGW